MSCTYTGYECGAQYADSICCEGYLWDADSGDSDSMLTHGGDLSWPPAIPRPISITCFNPQPGCCNLRMRRIMPNDDG